MMQTAANFYDYKISQICRLSDLRIGVFQSRNPGIWYWIATSIGGTYWS